MELLKPETDVMSPEGVEERIKSSVGAYVTLTGGGKYRAYITTDGKITSISVHDTVEEARKATTLILMAFSMFQIDPEATIKALLKPEAGGGA